MRGGAPAYFGPFPVAIVTIEVLIKWRTVSSLEDGPADFSGTGRFEILGRLGSGGMGVVYAAYDRARKMRVALKMLRQTDAVTLYRFKNEFRALADLSHPNLIRLYELVSSEDDWFFTMELVSGQTFFEHLLQAAPEHRSRATTAVIPGGAMATIAASPAGPRPRRAL